MITDFNLRIEPQYSGRPDMLNFRIRVRVNGEDIAYDREIPVHGFESHWELIMREATEIMREHFFKRNGRGMERQREDRSPRSRCFDKEYSDIRNFDDTFKLKIMGDFKM